MKDLTYISQPSQLADITERSQKLGFGMPSDPLLGCLLKTLAASKPAGRFLELGTGTGIGTAWLLSGMDSESRLTSIDTDATVQEVARQVLGADERLTLFLEDGVDFLQKQQPCAFDLVFADAMPGKYEGLEYALEAVKIGGFYVIDDMLPQENWPEGHAAKVPALLERLSARPDFALLPLVWSSGVAVAVRHK
jgi:predicted O-methyltransferase YrrM